jgi:hypothetical protein
MTDTSNASMSNTDTSAQKPPGWFLIVCKRLWEMHRAFWTVFGFGVVASVAAALLFLQWPLTANTNLNRTIIGWLLHNPLIVLGVGILLLLLDFIIYLGSRFDLPAPPVPSTPSTPVKTPEELHMEQQREQEKEAVRRYLQFMIRDTEVLALEGIPAGLIAESVRLDQVFIPLQLRPNRPRTDYPLTDAELERYRQWLKSGRSSLEMERALIEAEKDWLDALKRSDTVGIADIWQQLTKDRPAIVIQGYPGMGKSTLTKRLTLHMARCGLRQADLEMPGTEFLRPALIPILIRLGRYANASKEKPELSLEEYLADILNELNIPSVSPFIQDCLNTGGCLVLFDGLDEVSDHDTRRRVQEAIRAFIRNHRDGSEASFNRFLITSRVAGYDLAAFPEFQHFTIAELTDKQIDYFLQRWCRIKVRDSRESAFAPNGAQDDTKEIERKMKELETAIKGNQAVHELAGNPLLLTLLVVMQQNSIVLPRQRVELYDVVTRTLLENRNIAKMLTPVPEKLAIQYLGPVAFQMQEGGDSLVRERDVITSLQKTIRAKGGTSGEVELEAADFLKRIRERGGLFVQRTGDYFGFMHRTFQEYFAARYMLNKIKESQEQGIEELVSRARRNDDLWREPFLLAVAFQSDENEKVADEIIKELLTEPQEASQQQREHNLLLVAECLIEAKPLSIDPALERDIANQLLQTYERGQRERRFVVCEQIESVMRRWLLSLPKEAYRLSLLTVLFDAVAGSSNITCQRATLSLLASIAQELVDCPPNVFETLIPPLLALTGLPAAGNYQPTPGISQSSNMDVADLALTTLSFFGKRGPSALLLFDVRRYFKENPEHLHLLACYSLESSTLITPIVVPLTGENYRCYKAIEQWIELRDAQKTTSIIEQAIDKCLAIHQALLDCAEEVIYPATISLLDMLNTSVAHPEQSWQETWKTHLKNQLNSGQYLGYLESALLWVSLFPGQESQAALVQLILNQYNADGTILQRYAERFFATVSYDQSYLRYQSYLMDQRYLRDQRDLRDLRYRRDRRNLRDLGNMRKLRGLRDLILTQETARKAIDHLSLSADYEEQVDILTILQGRVLQISNAEEKGEGIEREIQQIVQSVYPIFTSASDNLLCEAAMDILYYLPARSPHEIQYVLSLAEDAKDKRVQQACAWSLEFTRPETEAAWAALEAGKQSKVMAVRTAVEKRLRRG